MIIHVMIKKDLKITTTATGTGVGFPIARVAMKGIKSLLHTKLPLTGSFFLRLYQIYKFLFFNSFIAKSDALAVSAI